MTATETIALKAMRAARDDNGWHEESLLVDAGTWALILDKMTPNDAAKIAQGVYDDHFKNYAGIL